MFIVFFVKERLIVVFSVFRFSFKSFLEPLFLSLIKLNLSYISMYSTIFFIHVKWRWKSDNPQKLYLKYDSEICFFLFLFILFLLEIRNHEFSSILFLSSELVKKFWFASVGLLSFFIFKSNFLLIYTITSIL